MRTTPSGRRLRHFVAADRGRHLNPMLAYDIA
jgi:hypothetical protein